MTGRKRKTRKDKADSPRNTATASAHSYEKPIAMAPWGIGFERTAFVLGLGLVCGAYLVLKMFGLQPYAGDEHIYMYQSKLVAEGMRPYADFAMAHPPLQTLIHASFLKLFGYPFLLGRLLPVGWCLLAGLLLADLVRRELGIVAAITATGLFLLSHEVLRSSTHATGVNATMAFCLAALLAHRRGWVLATAGLCTAAVLTRFYAAPAVIVLVLHGLLLDRRQGARLVGYGAALAAASFLALGLWTGFGDMWSNLFVYHASKTAMAEGTLANMRNTVLFHNATLASAFAIGTAVAMAEFIAAFFRQPGSLLPRLRHAAMVSNTGLVLLSSAIVLAYISVLSRMDRVWMYYFVPTFPLAAVAGGALFSKWGHAALALFRGRFALSRTDLSQGELLGLGGGLVVFAISLHLSPLLEQRLSYWQDEVSKPEQERSRIYTWRDGLLPQGVNAFVRENLWQDARVVGNRYFFWNYLLWHESRVLDITDEAVKTVLAHTEEHGEIFGDSGTVPLLALLSGRRIAANEVDTNIQRYRSGMAAPQALVEAIDRPSTQLIVLRPRFGVGGLAQIQDLVRNKYKRVKVLKSGQSATLVFFERRNGGL